MTEHVTIVRRKELLITALTIAHYLITEIRNGSLLNSYIIQYYTVYLHPVNMYLIVISGIHVHVLNLTNTNFILNLFEDPESNKHVLSQTR